MRLLKEKENPHFDHLQLRLPTPLLKLEIDNTHDCKPDETILDWSQHLK